LLIFNFSKHGILVFVLLFHLVLIQSCSGLEKFEKQELVIKCGGNELPIIAEIARSPAQHEQGLMYRKELKDGYGMLFVFDRDTTMSFWMKNTLIPLSIAYIAYDGRILEIYDMEPGNLNPVHSRRSARFALEVPQGWFSRAGIKIGDRLDISGL
jgi:uncharacterized membrane protein (UPF0127 family)